MQSAEVIISSKKKVNFILKTIDEVIIDEVHQEVGKFWCLVK